MRYSPFEVGRLILIISILALLLFRRENIYYSFAFLDPCSASVSPVSFTVNSNTSATITVTNNSSVTARYADFVSPTGDYVVTGGSSSGWDVEFNDSAEIAFHNGTIEPGQSHSFTVNLTIGSTVRSGDIWEARLDDNADGSDLNNCSGDLNASIVEADTTPPSISSISVTGVTTSQATITWTTDEASNSVVEYGTTASFGSSKTDSTNTTSHSVTITGLSAGTTYHYRVKSTDSNSNTATSNTNTFATSQSSTSSSPTATPTPTSSASSSSPTATPTPVPDTTSPSVVITTDLDTVFETYPEIRGRVTDNKGVEKVEFSIDGGVNWLPATFSGRGETAVSFTATSDIFDDGDYLTVIRATDASGNVGYSQSSNIVIDRLSPRIGGMVVTVGAQVLKPIESTILNGIVDTDHEVYLSAAGGPTEILLKAENGSETKEFRLTKKEKTNVWTGKIRFGQSGYYKLSAKALDGAENTTEKFLGGFAVFENGVLDFEGKSDDVDLTVYVFDEVLREFEVWDGASYGQQNPLTVMDGVYALILPKGRYYMEFESARHEMLRTEIFTLTLPTVINSDFSLKAKRGIELGQFFIPIPDLSTALTPSPVLLKNPGETAGSEYDSLVNSLFPIMTLLDGETEINTIDLRGENRLISIQNTWEPDIAGQIAFLETVSSLEITPSVIVINESPSKTAVFKKKGEYTVEIYSDPDGAILEQLPVIHMPTHVLLDKEGRILKIAGGLIDKNFVMK